MLSVYSHNVIGQYGSIEGCPKILRVDKGTENVHAATAQIALRMNHPDSMAGQKSLITGASVHNVVSLFSPPIASCIPPNLLVQKIEGWWSLLRRFKTEWWISFCKVLKIPYPNTFITIIIS